jgi:hypothetical protein
LDLLCINEEIVTHRDWMTSLSTHNPDFLINRMVFFLLVYF